MTWLIHFTASHNACVHLLLNLSHLQLSLEEAQLELAARGQQLLDTSAIIKSKDNLVSCKVSLLVFKSGESHVIFKV